VRIGFTSGPDSWLGRGELPHPAPGFELESFLFVEDLLGPDPAPADFLVLHRDLRREYDLRTVPNLLDQANEQHEDIGPLVERCRPLRGAGLRGRMAGGLQVALVKLRTPESAVND
jgi:hypothetical protein